MSAVPVPQVQFRPMRASDVSDVAALEKSLYAFPWSPGNFRDSVEAGYDCRVACEGSRVIGYAILMIALDEAHLLNLSIAEKRQGAGFGARLLCHAMRAAHEAGATSLLLEVRPSNPSALALYRHFGFQQIGVRRGYYPAEAGSEDALVMRHVLGKVSA